MGRKATLFVLAIVLADFVALNVWAIAGNGLLPLFQQALSTDGGILLTADLLIALGLVATWVYKDARARGANAWGWVAFTFATGSIGPLVFLIKRTLAEPAEPVSRPLRAAA